MQIFLTFYWPRCRISGIFIIKIFRHAWRTPRVVSLVMFLNQLFRQGVLSWMSASGFNALYSETQNINSVVWCMTGSKSHLFHPKLAGSLLVYILKKFDSYLSFGKWLAHSCTQSKMTHLCPDSIIDSCNRYRRHNYGVFLSVNLTSALWFRHIL